MPKAARDHFFCSSCGHEAPRWFGRCPACGAWNTAASAPATSTAAKAGRGRLTRWAPDAGGTQGRGPRPLGEIDTAAADRLPSGMPELDRVLGGGIMPASLVLVGGDPGIGKSTLMLQLAMRLAAQGRTVLYVSGEESEEQVRVRAMRIGPVPERLLLQCESELEAVLESAQSVQPSAMVVDSIQTLARADLEGGPGSVTQVRECALSLLHFAKAAKVAVFLVGHVTKDGAVAGPRVLEHMVDAVLYLEGERYQHYRVLRAAKNRFGSTHELGVFEMTDRGLCEVANPSEAFLSRSDRAEPGSAVVANLEGSRPLAVEVQALVSRSFYATPQRVTNGFDPRRLAVLLAVLERRVGLKLGRHDVFVTVTGGLTLDEPGTDLGVALAVASSFTSRPLLERSVVVGEVSLSGEVRRVSRIDLRIREAQQLGFTRVGVPAVQAGEVTASGLEILSLATVREAIEALLGPRVTVAGGEGLAENRFGDPRSQASAPPLRHPRGAGVPDSSKPAEPLPRP